MTHYNRKAWGARPPEARYRLDPLEVEGVALHWPAMPTPRTTVAQVMTALRAWQRFHMDTHGWSDIAYQIAVDQAGNWYQLRGLRHRSGANGDQDVNQRFGAFLLVVAEGERPSPELVRTVRHRIARFRHIFPNAHQILGHQDVRPHPGTTGPSTECPGPLVMDFIHRGRFEPKGPTPK